MHPITAPVRASIVACAVIAFSTGPFDAQRRSSSDRRAYSPVVFNRRPLVDRFYSAYANMSRDPARHMDAWLAFYDDSIVFEDPTYVQAEATDHVAIGRDAIRKNFMPAFQSGEWGPLEFRVDHWAESANWVAIEGVVTGLRKRTPVTTRFTTWLRFKGDRIVHQIDYLDYGAIDRQLKGEAPVALLIASSMPVKSRMTPAAMTQALREFYGIFNEEIIHGGAPAVSRFFSFFADSVRMEDPIDRRHITGRARYRRMFEQSLALPWGSARWVIARQVVTGDWAAVEGTFAGTFNERSFAARFSTWFQFRDGRITHQIDYFDHATFHRQVGLSAQ